MSARTIENCSVIRKMSAKGYAEPIRIRCIERCSGYPNPETDSECEKCRLYAAHREGNHKKLHGSDVQTINRTLNQIRSGNMPGVGKTFTIDTERGRAKVKIFYLKSRVEIFDRTKNTIYIIWDTFSNTVSRLAAIGADVDTIRSED